MDPESGSRALSAVNDLIELLRLAQSAADRLEHEVHGPSYEQADLIAQELHRLRRLTESLKTATERLVSLEDSADAVRGHPLRRASDHGIGLLPASSRSAN
jgi:small-conductance mechanosensitive channel